VRGFERRIVADTGLPYHQLWVRSLRSAGRDLHLLLDPLRLLASAPQAWWLLRRRRPAALFTTGGYLAVPLVVAARARGIPVLLWEGNVIPGRATRAVGRLATRVAVSFPPTLDDFAGRSFVSGTPIRSFAGIDRDAARAGFGLGPTDRLLLAFGGSQAVARLGGALTAVIGELVESWTVLHLAGQDGVATALRARDALPPTRRGRYLVEPFLTDRMADALVAADLVVGRAGSSTCAEVTAVGVASILVPYPYAGAHQRANAEWLASQGAAVVVPDGEFDGARLAREVGRLVGEGRRRQLAEAARRLGRPEAARLLASALLALAEGEPPPSAAPGRESVA